MRDARWWYLVIANIALGAAVAGCLAAVLYQILRESAPGMWKRLHHFIGFPYFQRRSRWT